MRKDLLLIVVLTAALSCVAVAVASPDADKEPTTRPVSIPPKLVTREQWGSLPLPFPESRKHTPKFVTIHHAGVDYKPGTDPAKFVSNMQGWGQRDKNWPDLPYHFLIAPDGRIFEARDMAYEPDTNTRYDLQGHIGVEMMGNFQTQRVSPQQLESIVHLIAWICQEKKIDVENIAGHNDVAPRQTSCPGKDFYRYLESGDLKAWVRRKMAGQDPEIDPGPPLPGGPTVVVGATTQPAAAASKQ